MTFKLTEPLAPRQLFVIARRVLQEYGIDLREVEEGIVIFRSKPGHRVARGAPARQWPVAAA